MSLRCRGVPRLALLPPHLLDTFLVWSFDLALLLRLPSLLPLAARTLVVLIILHCPLLSGSSFDTRNALAELAVESSPVNVALDDVSQLQASLVSLLAADGTV